MLNNILNFEHNKFINIFGGAFIMSNKENKKNNQRNNENRNNENQNQNQKNNQRNENNCR